MKKSRWEKLHERQYRRHLVWSKSMYGWHKWIENKMWFLRKEQPDRVKAFLVVMAGSGRAKRSPRKYGTLANRAKDA